MAVKFFGQYLLEKGIITREALLKAVELQDSVNLKFGAMARSMGLITDADIERVHEAQRTQDLQFGDMCIKLGILSEDKLKQVLAKQKSIHIFLGEALVRVGAVKAADLPAHLDAFKADQAPYVVEKVAIPAGIPHADVWEVVADFTYKMFSRVVNLTFRPGQCSVVKEIDPNETIVAMHMTGDVDCRYVLSVSRDVRNVIVRAILKEEDVSSEPNEVLVDAVMELVNIVCGNVAAKAAQLGKKIEIMPPEILDAKKKVSVPAGGKGLLFPLYVAEGRVEVAIFMDKV